MHFRLRVSFTYSTSSTLSVIFSEENVRHLSVSRRKKEKREERKEIENS